MVAGALNCASSFMSSLRAPPAWYLGIGDCSSASGIGRLLCNPLLCNLYSLNKKRDAVARFFRVSHNRAPMFEPAPSGNDAVDLATRAAGIAQQRSERFQRAFEAFWREAGEDSLDPWSKAIMGVKLELAQWRLESKSSNAVRNPCK
jgi:hypothetical protein